MALIVFEMISVVERVENIVGIGENAGYQLCFLKASFLGLS